MLDSELDDNILTFYKILKIEPTLICSSDNIPVFILNKLSHHGSKANSQ